MSKRHASFAGNVALQSKKIRQIPKKIQQGSISSESQVSSMSSMQNQSSSSRYAKQKNQQQTNKDNHSQNSRIKNEHQNSSSSFNPQILFSSSSSLIKKNTSQDEQSSEKIEVQKKDKIQSDSKKKQIIVKKNEIIQLAKPLIKKIPKESKIQQQRKVDPPQEYESDNKIKANQNYKPKNFSQPYNILKAMYLLQAHMRPKSTEQIQQKYLTFKQSNFGQWHKHIQRLTVNSYIATEEKSDNRLRLLQKGERFISPRVAKIDKRELQKKQQQKSAPAFKKNFKTKQNNPAPISRQKIKPPPPQNNYKYFKDGSNCYDQYPKQVISSSKNADKIKMIVNQMAPSLSQNIEYFTQVMERDGSIKFQVSQVFSNINFFWQVEGKILDRFAVLIKNTQTDLQLIKNSLSESKYCNCQNMIVILQQKNRTRIKSQEENSIIQQQKQENHRRVSKQLEQFAFKCRASGFNVMKTKNQQQTVLYLRKITYLLAKKIRNIAETGQHVSHCGPLQKLNQWFKLYKAYNQRRINIKCLRRMKCFTAQSLQRIAQKLPTFACLYSKLSKLDTNQQRQRFLDWFLNKHGSDKQANWKLVCLLFYRNYNKYKRRDLMQNLQQEQSQQQQQQQPQQQQKQQSQNSDSSSSSKKQKLKQIKKQKETQKQISKQGFKKNQKQSSKAKQSLRQKQKQKERQKQMQRIKQKAKQQIKQQKLSKKQKYNQEKKPNQSKAPIKYYVYQSDDQYIV